MLKHFLFLLFIPFLQDVDNQLIGGWRMISLEGDPVEENVVLTMHRDHHFELGDDEDKEEGRWRVIEGSNESLLSLKMNYSETEDIFSMRFSGDSLFLVLEDEEAVFLRLK